MLKRLRRYWWIVAVAILLVIIAIIWNRTHQTSIDTSNPYTIKKQTLQEELTISGTIAADEQVSLRFQTGGLLTYVGVREGDTVQKGAVIASLDQRQLRKTLDKYLNTYSKERLDFDNERGERDVKALPSDSLARQDIVDSFAKAQYDLTNSVLDVELQDIALRYSTLTSPINGIVSHMDVSVTGVNVLPTTTFEIINPQTMYISAAADQTDIVRLHAGMAGTVIYDAYPDVTMSTTIQSIAYTPQENETGTVYEVKLTIPESTTSTYRVGMTGDVSFVVKEKPNAIAVPITAIQAENDGTSKFVYKDDNGRVVKAPITEGETYDAQVEIVRGLKVGDVIYD